MSAWIRAKKSGTDCHRRAFCLSAIPQAKPVVRLVQFTATALSSDFPRPTVLSACLMFLNCHPLRPDKPTLSSRRFPDLLDQDVSWPRHSSLEQCS